jgi:hypothetical protein
MKDNIQEENAVSPKFRMILVKVLFSSQSQFNIG